jgi:hypothetical protein
MIWLMVVGEKLCPFAGVSLSNRFPGSIKNPSFVVPQSQFGSARCTQLLAPPRGLPEGVRRNVMLDTVTPSPARGYMCQVALAVVRNEES